VQIVGLITPIFWETLLLKTAFESLLQKREDTYPRVASKGGDFIRINEVDVFFFCEYEWMSFTDLEMKALWLYQTKNSACLSIILRYSSDCNHSRGSV